MRSDIDDKLIELLAGGKNATQAAALLGLSVSTVHRRRRDPLFNARLTEARADRLRPVMDKVTDAADPAIDRLRTLMDDPDTAPSTQVRAAAAILDLVLKLHATVDLAPRLAAIEAAQAARDEGADDDRDSGVAVESGATEPGD